jgi:hypothetical protein
VVCPNCGNDIGDFKGRFCPHCDVSVGVVRRRQTTKPKIIGPVRCRECGRQTTYVICRYCRLPTGLTEEIKEGGVMPNHEMSGLREIELDDEDDETPLELDVDEKSRG